MISGHWHLPVSELPEAVQRHVSESGARIRIGYPRLLRPFLRGFIAITLGRSIYVAPELLERGKGIFEKTIRHELAHLRQMARLGLFRFYSLYVMEYLRLRLARMSHMEAYDAISFEQEARAEAAEEGTLV